MCGSIFLGLLGLVVGFLSSLVAMKINFKHNVIKSKVKTYNGLFSLWLDMRNKIYELQQSKQERDLTQLQKYFIEFDRLYSQSFSFIGKTFLLSENDLLSVKILNFNRKFFDLEQSLIKDTFQGDIDIEMNSLLEEGIKLAKELRMNVGDSSILWRKDFFQIFSGLFSCKQE